MDVQILRAIVQSREAENPEGFGEAGMEKFPPAHPEILAALAKSFTDLITFKVSPEAYQRYSVRLQVIEVLRDWLRPRGELESSRAFSRGERVLEFVGRILKVYLKNEAIFQDDGNMNVLVNLARALMCLAPRNKTFVPELERLLARIADLRQNEESLRLVLSAVKEKDPLELSFQTVERLYICQSAKLIEEPLVENFVEFLRDSRENAASEELKTNPGTEELLKVAAESPIIFQIVSSILKEILVHSDYSPKVLDYIKKILKALGSLCQRRNKNVLDLYPLRLQSCVLLLNIEPEQHTPQSRDYVLRELEKINEANPDETLVLLSHFPGWLDELGARLEDSKGDRDF